MDDPQRIKVLGFAGSLRIDWASRPPDQPFDGNRRRAIAWGFVF